MEPSEATANSPPDSDDLPFAQNGYKLFNRSNDDGLEALVIARAGLWIMQWLPISA